MVQDRFELSVFGRIMEMANLDLRQREFIKWIQSSFRGVAFWKGLFASRTPSVAHDLGVQDPMDTVDAVEMVEGILADLETGEDDVGRDLWFVEWLDLLKMAAEGLSVVCVNVENRKTGLGLANIEAELSGAKAVLSEHEDNASVFEFFVHESDGWRCVVGF